MKFTTRPRLGLNVAVEDCRCALCGGPINVGANVSRKAGLVMHAEHSRAAKQLTVLRAQAEAKAS